MVPSPAHHIKEEKKNVQIPPSWRRSCEVKPLIRAKSWMWRLLPKILTKGFCRKTPIPIQTNNYTLCWMHSCWRRGKDPPFVFIRHFMEIISIQEIQSWIWIHFSHTVWLIRYYCFFGLHHADWNIKQNCTCHHKCFLEVNSHSWTRLHLRSCVFFFIPDPVFDIYVRFLMKAVWGAVQWGVCYLRNGVALCCLCVVVHLICE